MVGLIPVGAGPGLVFGLPGLFFCLPDMLALCASPLSITASCAELPLILAYNALPFVCINPCLLSYRQRPSSPPESAFIAASLPFMPFNFAFYLAGQGQQRSRRLSCQQGQEGRQPPFRGGHWGTPGGRRSQEGKEDHQLFGQQGQQDCQQDCLQGLQQPLSQQPSQQ